MYLPAAVIAVSSTLRSTDRIDNRISAYTYIYILYIYNLCVYNMYVYTHTPITYDMHTRRSVNSNI